MAAIEIYGVMLFYSESKSDELAQNDIFWE